MKEFRVGETVLKEKIDNEIWVFTISDVFHLSQEEYKSNVAYNDTLGNYEPDKELPTNSTAIITGASQSGKLVELRWSSGFNKVYPHLSLKGWSKGIFLKLNIELAKWAFPNTNETHRNN
jgi:hypothetical protein